MELPITLVSGFLGSGKTTLINQVLKDPSVEPHQIVVIENEIGDVGVDHQLIFESVEQIYQMNQGCICCDLRSDLLQILSQIREMYETGIWDLKHIIIETTGIADPRPIIKTLRLLEASSGLFGLDAVYSVVDCINYQHTLAQYEEASAQIVFADRIYLSKSEEADIAAVKADIQQLNPFASFEIFTLDQTIQPGSFFNQALYNREDIDLSEVAEAHGHTHSHEDHDHPHEGHDAHTAHDHDHDHHHEGHDAHTAHDHDHHHEGHDAHTTHDHHHHHHHHDHHHGIQTIYLDTSVPLSKKYVYYFLDWLLMNYQDKLYRYKGFFCLSDREYPYLLQGVGTNYEFDPIEKREAADTQVVLIGKKMDEVLIRQAFDDLKSLSLNEKA